MGLSSTGTAAFAYVAASTLSTTAPVVPSVTARPPTQVRGVPGGANFSGRLLFEFNSALRDQAGYGRAGTYEVGEWAQIAASNPFVAMALDFISAPIADARVVVEAAKKDNPDAAKHAEFLEWALTQAFRLQSHNEMAARGFLLSGFSLFSLAFEQVECELLGRPAWVPSELAERLPNSLDANPWIEDERGNLIEIQQNGPIGMSGKWERPRLKAEEVLLYSWEQRANNWAGVSQFRSVWYIAGRIMPMLIKMIGVTLQREGAGLPVAVPLDANAPELTPDQRDELMSFFANATFHESSGVVMPRGWGVEWIQSPGANKGHIVDVIQSLGSWILFQLGAQQLTLGVNGTGSRSVGEVHDGKSMMHVRRVLSFEESVINGDKKSRAHTGLAKRLIDFNFGPQSAYPRVKLVPQRPELPPQDLAQATKTAKDAGIFTPRTEDENNWRERAGYELITEEERAEAKEKAAALAPPAPGFPPKPEDEPKGGEQPGPKGRPLQASAPRVWTPWRPLRASEAKMDLRGIDAFFAEQREAGGRRIQSEVLAMLGKAAPAVAAAMADGKVQPEEIANLQFDTKRLEKAVAALLAEVRAKGAESVRKEIGPGVLRAAEEDDDFTTKADEVIDAERSRVVRKIVNRTRGELEREAVDALRTGGTAQEVIDRAIDTQIESGAFKGDAGTVVTKVFNLGRQEAAERLNVASVTYTAILDSATCSPCQSMDGRTAAFGSPEHDAMVPPNRDCDGWDNCRCLLTYEMGGDS